MDLGVGYLNAIRGNLSAQTVGRGSVSAYYQDYSKRSTKEIATELLQLSRLYSQRAEIYKLAAKLAGLENERDPGLNARASDYLPSVLMDHNGDFAGFAIGRDNCFKREDVYFADSEEELSVTPRDEDYREIYFQEKDILARITAIRRVLADMEKLEATITNNGRVNPSVGEKVAGPFRPKHPELPSGPPHSPKYASPSCKGFECNLRYLLGPNSDELTQ